MNIMCQFLCQNLKEFEGPSATSKRRKIEKPRLYNSEYLKFGFTFAGSKSNPRP